MTDGELKMYKLSALHISTALSQGVIVPEHTYVPVESLDAAKKEFPKLQPIIVFPPTLIKSTGDITTDILNNYLSREHEFADAQHQAETNIVKYIKEIDGWQKKWLDDVEVKTE